ncbi:MAG: hypothetical protein JOY82_23800 [Streptosporangiaceae bacterium]|nr:hypothetical protein [Streptosporangiaceae bacterium]MBV9857508.1 hypothetical protein [Streptosporangiaceae bacterium]
MGDGVRAPLERAASLDEAMRRARELTARTMIFDVEPLVAHWESDQAALEHGIARVVSELAAAPSVRVLCFSTNSARRPSAMPEPDGAGPRPQVVYLASAGKPLRIAPYRDFPRPGMVVGDQIVTDGILARRLGYTFVLYDPRLADVPAGPRLLGAGGRLVRHLLFSRGD